MLWEIGCKRSRKRRENWKKKKRKKDYGIIYKIKRPFNKVADEKQISKSLSWIFESAYSKDIDIEIRMNSVLRIISFLSLSVLCIRKFQFEICFITSSTLYWAVKMNKCTTSEAMHQHLLFYLRHQILQLRVYKMVYISIYQIHLFQI